jgi:hypothetical protein
LGAISHRYLPHYCHFHDDCLGSFDDFSSSIIR